LTRPQTGERVIIPGESHESFVGESAQWDDRSLGKTPINAVDVSVCRSIESMQNLSS
jgi:hypothetical protein